MSRLVGLEGQGFPVDLAFPVLLSPPRPARWDRVVLAFPVLRSSVTQEQ
ncbi:hypothetical protein [Mycolicibacterium sp. 018/SC-01/001]|nr:hypothetical protein [Mycolicibacterium sp. 018/SC-01/001]